MAKIRNPEARCENCPYAQGLVGSLNCTRRAPVVFIDKCGYAHTIFPRAKPVCGEHPDFLIDAPEPLDNPASPV